MSGRARDACSLRRKLSHIVRTTTLGTIMPSLSRLCVQQQQLSQLKVHGPSQTAVVEILGLKAFKWERRASLLLKNFPFIEKHLRFTPSGFRGGHNGFNPCRALQTIAPVAEKPLSKETLLVVVDHTADDLLVIQRALTEYLELTLKVPHELAFEISHKCPAFLNRLKEELELELRSASGQDRSVSTLVKDHLSVSKFKGVDPFLESLGVPLDDIAKVSAYARSGIKGVKVKVDALKIIGVKPEEVSRILTKYPRFLSNALVTHQLKVEYLARLGMTPLEICKLVTSYPNSLSFSLKDGDLPLVTFLRKLGVQDHDLKTVVSRCPQLLTLNVERKLQGAIDTLASVGITGHYLARVLVVQPSLLRRRLERNIAFCREVGLDAKPGVIARLLVTCPNFSVDGCNARINYLKSVGLTEEQIFRMITQNPAFLSLNVETSLAPKVEYVTNVMGRPVEQLVTSATFLTMSLENRIMPRHKVLVALDEGGLLQRSYSLNTIVTWSNEYFFRKFVQKSPMRVRQIWAKSTK